MAWADLKKVDLLIRTVGQGEEHHTESINHILN